MFVTAPCGPVGGGWSSEETPGQSAQALGPLGRGKARPSGSVKTASKKSESGSPGKSWAPGARPFWPSSRSLVPRPSWAAMWMTAMGLMTSRSPPNPR